MYYYCFYLNLDPLSALMTVNHGYLFDQKTQSWVALYYDIVGTLEVCNIVV